MRRRNKKKGLGGAIGTALGATAGSFVGMPHVGGMVGGAIGTSVSGQDQEQKNMAQQKIKRIPYVRRAAGSLGHKYGGKKKNTGGRKSPQNLKSKLKFSTSQLPPSFNSMDVLTNPPEMENLNHPASDQNLGTRDQMFANEGAMMNREMGSERYSHLEPTTRSGQRGAHTGKYKYGGTRGNLKEYRGRKHEHGGIMLDDGTEVEDGETQTDIGGNEYIFSDEVIVPETNKTFATVSKELAGQGAGEQEYDRLARLQEQETGRTQTMKQGGLKRSHGGSMSRGGETPGSSYQDGGRLTREEQIRNVQRPSLEGQERDRRIRSATSGRDVRPTRSGMPRSLVNIGRGARRFGRWALGPKVGAVLTLAENVISPTELGDATADHSDFHDQMRRDRFFRDLLTGRRSVLPEMEDEDDEAYRDVSPLSKSYTRSESSDDEDPNQLSEEKQKSTGSGIDRKGSDINYRDRELHGSKDIRTPEKIERTMRRQLKHGGKRKMKYETGNGMPRPVVSGSRRIPDTSDLQIPDIAKGRTSQPFESLEFELEKPNRIGGVISPDTSSSKPDGIGFSDIAPYLGPAMNLAHGIFGDDEVPDVPRIQRTEVRMPDAPSPRPQLGRAAAAHRTAMSHPGVSAQERLAGHAQRLGHESDIWAQHHQQQTQLDAQQAQTQAQLDAQRTGQQAQLDMQQREDEMIADAQFGVFGQQAREALGQALGVYGQKQQMEQLQQMDETQLATVLAGLSDEVREEILQAIGRA